MTADVWFHQFAHDATDTARTEGGPRVAATRCPPDWLTAAPDWTPFWELLAARLFPVRYVFLESDRALPTELYWEMAHRLRPATTGWTPGSHQGFHRHHAEFVDTLLATTTTGLTTGPAGPHELIGGSP